MLCMVLVPKRAWSGSFLGCDIGFAGRFKTGPFTLAILYLLTVLELSDDGLKLVLHLSPTADAHLPVLVQAVLESIH